MAKPLLVTDCDEVLLHMVRHFRDWLDREHDVAFNPEGNNFARSMTRRGSEQPMEEAEMWSLLGSFFDTQMDKQTPIPGAIEAISELQRDAEVVVLTNLNHDRNEARTRQLQRLGINAKVYTNQGPKGGALQAIIEEYAPSRAVFVDDIAKHHESAAEMAPNVHRLHFCGEPTLAPHINCGFKSGHAHARIDSWDHALPWIGNTLFGDD